MFIIGKAKKPHVAAEDRTDHVDRLAADAVRQPADQRDDGEVHACATSSTRGSGTGVGVHLTFR